MIEYNFTIPRTGNIATDLKDLVLPKDSLEFAEMVMIVEEHYDIEIPDEIVVNIKSIEDLVKAVEKQLNG